MIKSTVTLKLALARQLKRRRSPPGVLLQVGQLTEGVLAVGAVVGFDPQVDTQVLGQVGGVGERLGAVGTLVRFGLRVGLGVDLHLGLG